MNCYNRVGYKKIDTPKQQLKTERLLNQTFSPKRYLKQKLSRNLIYFSNDAMGTQKV